MLVAHQVGRAIRANPNLEKNMSIETKISTAASSDASAGARYDAFAIRNYERENELRAEWSKIGVAFPHHDGNASGCC